MADGKNTTMNNLNAWGLDQSTAQQQQEAERIVDSVLDSTRQPLIYAVVYFFENPISPVALMTFEVAMLVLCESWEGGCWNVCSMCVSQARWTNSRKIPGYSFTSSCSLPPFTRTQLLSVTDRSVQT